MRMSIEFKVRSRYCNSRLSILWEIINNQKMGLESLLPWPNAAYLFIDTACQKSLWLVPTWPKGQLPTCCQLPQGYFFGSWSLFSFFFFYFLLAPISQGTREFNCLPVTSLSGKYFLFLCPKSNSCICAFITAKYCYFSSYTGSI